MAELHITQYLRPNGHAEDVICDVDDSIAEMAKGMVLTAEVLRDGNVAIYVRRGGEPDSAEITRIAENGPGARSPENMLIQAIQEKHAQPTGVGGE